MKDLFEYNPTPWTHARCGDNWDINLPSEPDATGVGVVATVFAGEGIARFLATAPEVSAAARKLAERTIKYVTPLDPNMECDVEMHALATDLLALLAQSHQETQG